MSNPSSTARRRIVILGGGFAGAYCAQQLERELRHETDVEILLIDRHNFFVFYPLLIEAGTGSLEPRHAVVPIRSFLRRGLFRMAEATAVDVQRQTVSYRVVDTDEVRTRPYDHLVLALGSVTLLPPVPGLREHGFEMKHLGDAISLRDRAIRLLEQADATHDPVARRRLLHFVVVGGNFTGSEVAGEFHAFLRRAAKGYRNVDPRECNVTLIDRSPRILEAINDPELSEFAESHLRGRGIRVLTKTSAMELGEDWVRLDSGEVLEASTTIWCAGIAPTPLAPLVDAPHDKRGYLLTDLDLRVQGLPNVWAIGDCAVNVGPDGKPYAPTAQTAIRTGPWCARNIARVMRGEPTRPAIIPNYGGLAGLGCRSGVAKLFGIELAGFPAWFLWRTVYLLKMPGWRRKLRVAADWTLDLLSPREQVQLGLHKRKDTSAPAIGAAVTGSVSAEPRASVQV